MNKINKSHLFILLPFIILLFPLFASFASQYTPVSTRVNPPDSLTAKEANDLILKNKDNLDFIILDVRTPEEYSDGHIEGSLNIDYKSENFKNEISKLSPDKTYLVYCRSGRRSKASQDIMLSSGFYNVINLTGGFEDWKKELLPFVK